MAVGDYTMCAYLIHSYCKSPSLREVFHLFLGVRDEKVRVDGRIRW